MKWKCENCPEGPCRFECNYEYWTVFHQRCPLINAVANWQKMSDEEPEPEKEKWWGYWIKPGNYIYVDATKNIANCKGIFRIVGTQNGMWLDLEHRFTKKKFYFGEMLVIDFIKKYEVRQVFPKPYTFETAPVVLKVRRKEDGMKDIMRLKLSAQNGAYWDEMFGYRSISYDELLQNWEQLDGWPCGTFDEEE